jgi:hypothetical protein
MVEKSKIKSLAALAQQTIQSPTYESTTDVRVTGEALQEPIYWKGRQWAVTSYGIEARDGKYPIKGECVWEDNNDYGWVEHMAEKEWVDLTDFVEALRLARARWPKKTHKPDRLN